MTRTTIAATPKKLRSGRWGALAQSSSVRIGDTVTITTRAGKSWDATVTEIVQSLGDTTIVATQSRDRVARQTGSLNISTHRYVGASSCGYPCPVTRRRCTPSDPCHDCI